MYDWYMGEGRGSPGIANGSTEGRRDLLIREGLIFRNVYSFHTERSSQRSLQLLSDAAVIWTELRPSMSTTGWERLKHVASKESALWLQKPRTMGDKRPLPSDNFGVALNLRLGLLGFHFPLSQLCEAPCPRCSAFIEDPEELSRHILTCPETALIGGVEVSLKTRHERLADRLRYCETLGGAEVRKEPRFTSHASDTALRADWVSARSSHNPRELGAGNQRYVDLTVSTPREKESGSLARAETSKTEKYTSLLQNGET